MDATICRQGTTSTLRATGAVSDPGSEKTREKGTTAMTSTKHVLLTAALALALGNTAQAFTGDSQDEPFSLQGRSQVFNRSLPELNVGSEAYPSTAGQGGAGDGRVTNHVTREGVPSYQHGFDTGAEAYPAPR
jgi:hypothetical protein